MRKRSDAREAHRELLVVGVGEPDARRLDEEAHSLSVYHRCIGCGPTLNAGQGSCLVGRDDGLVERAIGQPNPALVAVPNQPHILQRHRHVEVTGERDPMPDRERELRVHHHRTLRLDLRDPVGGRLRDAAPASATPPAVTHVSTSDNLNRRSRPTRCDEKLFELNRR